MTTREQVSTDRWAEEYQRVVSLTERRNAFFGVWDTSAKVVWACRKALREYEGKTNRDEAYVSMLSQMEVIAQGKVNQLDPIIARIDSEIAARMEYLQNHEGVA